MYLYAKSRLRKNALQIVEHTKSQKGYNYTYNILYYLINLYTCLYTYSNVYFIIYYIHAIYMLLYVYYILYTYSYTIYATIYTIHDRRHLRHEARCKVLLHTARRARSSQVNIYYILQVLYYTYVSKVNTYYTLLTIEGHEECDYYYYIYMYIYVYHVCMSI